MHACTPELLCPLVKQCRFDWANCKWPTSILFHIISVCPCLLILSHFLVFFLLPNFLDAFLLQQNVKEFRSIIEMKWGSGAGDSRLDMQYNSKSALKTNKCVQILYTWICMHVCHVCQCACACACVCLFVWASVSVESIQFLAICQNICNTFYIG